MVHKLYAHSQLISFSTGTSIQLVQQHEQHAACIKPVQITIKTHCLWPRALQEGWLNKNYVCSIKVTQSMSLSTSHWLTTTTVLRPFVRATRVSRFQKKHSPTHHPDHHPIFISFFHLPRSIATSLFKLRAWQSFCTTSFHVVFGLPLGLEPSTSYSIHFFT